MKSGGWKLLSGVSLASVIIGVGLNAYPNTAAPEFKNSFPPAMREMSIQDLRDGITIPHFSKISGIAGQLEEDGISLPPGLEIRVRYATKLSETKYIQYEAHPDMQTSYDMAASEGAMEARNGEWSIDALSHYVDEVMGLDQRFVEVAEAASAYLQDEGVSPEDADFYIRQSIGLAYYDHLNASDVEPTERDERVLVRMSDHDALVADLHGRIHQFFQHHLSMLDIADDGFRFSPVEPDTVEVSDDVTSIDASFEMDI